MTGAPVRQYTLVLSKHDTAELLADGVTVWASDTDPDLADELGTDTVREGDLGDVLDYLADTGRMSEDEADECLIEGPDDTDDGQAEEPEGEELTP